MPLPKAQEVDGSGSLVHQMMERLSHSLTPRFSKHNRTFTRRFMTSMFLKTWSKISKRGSGIEKWNKDLSRIYATKPPFGHCRWVRFFLLTQKLKKATLSDTIIFYLCHKSLSNIS